MIDIKLTPVQKDAVKPQDDGDAAVEMYAAGTLL